MGVSAKNPTYLLVNSNGFASFLCFFVKFIRDNTRKKKITWELVRVAPVLQKIGSPQKTFKSSFSAVIAKSVKYGGFLDFTYGS